MEKFIKMVKKRMIERGRDDFVNYLSEILGISKQWASTKLNQGKFTGDEIAALNKELDFDANELKSTLESDCCEHDGDRVCETAE